jgi:hypothetical protein
MDDLYIIVSETGGYTPVLPKFIEKMRKKTRVTLKWEPDTENYVVDSEKQIVTYTQGDTWRNPIFSSEPLREQITYHEIRLHNKGHLLFYGIAKGKNIGTSTFLDSTSTCCLFTDPSSLGSRSITVIKDCTAKKGDVLGLVVDKLREEIRFYRNGVLIAKGMQKPTSMEPMYIVSWLYYRDSAIETCTVHPYELLKLE